MNLTSETSIFSSEVVTSIETNRKNYRVIVLKYMEKNAIYKKIFKHLSKSEARELISKWLHDSRVVRVDVDLVFGLSNKTAAYWNDYKHVLEFCAIHGGEVEREGWTAEYVDSEGVEGLAADYEVVKNAYMAWLADTPMKEWVPFQTWAWRNPTIGGTVTT